jgi:hypothetical protein
MGRWSAPSDFDYYDASHHHDGIERTCHGCGDPVMVSRGDAYQLQVFCERCLTRQRESRMVTVHANQKAGAA